MTKHFSQAGAIPCRVVHGEIEVLLISTSSGRHQTIPKGLIDPGFTAVETVHNEAWEEAGIKGELLMPSIGTYRFPKWGGICEVSVFVMMVNRLAVAWPEDAHRRRTWMIYRRAARQVRHRDLAELILNVPTKISGRKADD